MINNRNRIQYGLFRLKQANKISLQEGVMNLEAFDVFLRELPGTEAENNYQ